VLSAIASYRSQDHVVMQAFETYVASFQHVLKKEQCPEKTSK